MQIHIPALTCILQRIDNTGLLCGAALAISTGGSCAIKSEQVSRGHFSQPDLVRFYERQDSKNSGVKQNEA
jgi:hypothetical protein